MSNLSDKTRKLVHGLYQSREALEICDMLENECGAEAFSCDGWSPVEMERIHFAVLRLAHEDVMGFDSAVQFAQRDWRDLLMSAGFGNDLESHKKWANKNAY